MEKIKKFLKSEKALILVFAILVALIAIFAIVKANNTKKDDDEAARYQEKVEEAKKYMGIIALKDKVYLQGEEFSTDINDYLLYVPEGVEIDAMKLELPKVDENSLGNYIYHVYYYEIDIVGNIYIVETEEEKKIAEAEINNEEKDFLENVEKQKDYDDTEDQKPAEPELPTNTDISGNQEPEDDTDLDISNMHPNGEPQTGAQNVDRTITKLTYNFSNNIPDTIELDAPNYKNELWYVFENPIVQDDWGITAFNNWNSGKRKLMQAEASKLAEKYFGSDNNYCVQHTEVFYAKNKNGDVIGIALKAIVGQTDGYGCYANTTTLYSNSRITAYQDNVNLTFSTK